MAENRRNETRTGGKGPFPEPQPRERPWEAEEMARGPFERRRPEDRGGPIAETEQSGSDEGGRRRRWGRRKGDVLTTEARQSLTEQGRSFARRFRKPLIGLTLAGMAVPVVNATTMPVETKSTKKKSDVEESASDPLPAERDLDEEVGDYWAEAEADVVRDHTIEGAVTRWDIDADLAEKIYDYAAKHEIEPDVAYGLVFTESTFRERAVSHVGARGLTQLMPRTAKWLEPGVGTRDLYDPDVNLDIGFRYLKQLIEKYDGNLEHALTAYNRGPGTVDRILDRGGNPDNGYAGKVLAG